LESTPLTFAADKVPGACSFLLDLLCAEYFLTTARKASLDAVGSTFPSRMSENGTNLPYRSRVSSLSCVMAEPFRSTPANNPRAREYVNTSERILMSVSAPASRPTGPAAAEASAPSLNLLLRRWCMPDSFITTSTRSTAWPPNCRPQLPPVIVMGAGALQPFPVRQLAIPLPWLPPNPTAIFTMEGITAMHCALPMTLSGIALSGVAIISSKTFAEASIRLAMSDLLFSSAAQLALTSTEQRLPTKRHLSPTERMCRMALSSSVFPHGNTIVPCETKLSSRSLSSYPAEAVNKRRSF